MMSNSTSAAASATPSAGKSPTGAKPAILETANVLATDAVATAVMADANANFTDTLQMMAQKPSVDAAQVSYGAGLSAADAEPADPELTAPDPTSLELTAPDPTATQATAVQATAMQASNAQAAPPVSLTSDAISAQLLQLLGIAQQDQSLRTNTMSVTQSGVATNEHDDADGAGGMTSISADAGVRGAQGGAAALEQLVRQLERAVMANPIGADALAAANGVSPDRAVKDGSHKQVAVPVYNATAPQLLTDTFALHRSASELVPRALEASVGTKAWQDQLGNQISWMLDRGEQLATLRLSPEHLGPVEVRIAVRESEATVWFGATQPDTRAALEQALPRLREMLASQGIALTQSGVSGDSPRNRHRERSDASLAIMPVESVEPVAGEKSRTTSVRLVDLYA